MQRKTLIAVSAAAMALGLAACDRADERTAATDTSATARTEQAARDSGTKAREAVRETRQETRQAAADVREESREAARDARSAAREATASAESGLDRAAQDTRAMGAAAASKVDDVSVTAKVNAAIAADKELSALRIDVDTRNGVVTLSGPAPTATAKERAAEAALKVKGVRSVNNQLTIKAG